MTLSTDVYILDEVDPAEVFRFCQSMLTKYDGASRTPDEQKSSTFPDGGWKRDTEIELGDVVFPGRDWVNDRTGERSVWVVTAGGAWSRDNAIGQGLPAWVMSAYRPDGPLRTPKQAAEHDEWCDDDCDPIKDHARACWMWVDFDTGYGYRDERGWGCGDLHAALVGELGDWLTAKGVRWEWRNEFTGDVHTGRDGLAELGPQGAEAGHWYATQALPAIVTHIATEVRP